MEEINRHIFISLFKEACERAFGYSVSSPLTETDSKLLSNKILEQTGLVIGAKSIKNYSRDIFAPDKNDPVKENPSVATLDTLARFVLNAPYTNEIQRKNNESHYPYWFQYKSSLVAPDKKRTTIANRKIATFIIATVILSALLFYAVKIFREEKRQGLFSDNFNSVELDSLLKRGWIIKSTDNIWWSKRNEKPGHLTLYTLRGDNWSLGENRAHISNLMMKKIDSDCFVTEVQLSDFIPQHNWQQAGIIISEDSAFTGKMLRLSIAYNSFFGGFEKSPEIIIQAISSSEVGVQSKPEEIIHLPLFTLEKDDSLASLNLKRSALKIEKKGKNFKFLFSVSSSESFSYNKASEGEFSIQPRFVSIFSIQGWASDSKIIPAYFDSFSMMPLKCND